jgi:hypothetical protein
MRIFLDPPYPGGSADQCARQALEALREAGVASARTRESIRDQAVVLVDWPDVAKALTVLGKARMRVLDSASNTTLSTLDTQPRFLIASARSTGMKLLRHAPTGMALALALAALVITGGGPISIRKLPDAPALVLVRWYLMLPPLHFVGPANDPYRLAIVSGAALLCRWLPVAPDDPASRKNSGPPDSARKRPLGAFDTRRSSGPQHARELVGKILAIDCDDAIVTRKSICFPALIVRQRRVPKPTVFYQHGR